jgi:hypothetical protein
MADAFRKFICELYTVIVPTLKVLKNALSPEAIPKFNSPVLSDDTRKRSE